MKTMHTCKKCVHFLPMDKGKLEATCKPIRTTVTRVMVLICHLGEKIIPSTEEPVYYRKKSIQLSP